jgi:hypothetical protein
MEEIFMSVESALETQRGKDMTDALKGWVMVVLTLLFVILYAAALIGWLRPLADITMITRLEPIIFVIIGYYFGRLPAQQNEKTLKAEITRQTIKADATQQAKEQAQREREVIEEKIKNAKAVLLQSLPDALNDGPRAPMSFGGGQGAASDKNGAVHHSIKTAVRILES